MEGEAADLNNLETLFDIQKSTYKQLKDCGTELCLLKQMWDLVALIDFQFEAWKSTLWDKIDTEVLMQLVKDMQTKQCNPQSPQNKDIKNWKAFLALNERVKNMNTILPLINMLKSPFMMDRHWKKIETLTGKTVDHKGASFCLENLVELDLFKFSEEVNEIVDGAAKEAKIEIKLNNIQKVWEESVFEFKEYKEVPILHALDEIMETVDLHSMELMGMMSSKDVEEFKDKVMFWQKNLKTVDQVIFIWVKVQRQW